MQSFRRLRVYHRSRRLAVNIHRLTALFRGRGYSELVSQMVRAANSIPRNIVEGSAATTDREYGRFLNISTRSASELEHHVQTARDFRLISKDLWGRFTMEIIGVRKDICALRRTVIRSAEREEEAKRQRSRRKPRLSDRPATN